MTTEIQTCNVYTLDGGPPHHGTLEKDFLVIKRTVGRCQVFILVWRDYSRAFMGGGVLGYTWRADELDDLAIEALAERFDLAELRQVLSRRKELAITKNG